MDSLKPIEPVSYTNTQGKIFQYASAGVAVDVSQDDVTGDCVIFYQTEVGHRWLVRTYEQAQRFVSLVMNRYPMKQFQCAVDY